MKHTLLLAAAGPGTRLGLHKPKALIDIGGVSLLVRTLRRFEAAGLVDGAVIAVAPESRAAFEAVLTEFYGQSNFRVVEGGAERQISVAKALAKVDESTDLVVIHDAARPFVDESDIQATIAAAEATGAATLATPCVDTILESDDGRMLIDTPARERLWLCETPQVFALDIIREAHARAAERGLRYTDDATLVRESGHPVKIVAGRPGNVKITTKADLAFAEYVVQKGRA